MENSADDVGCTRRREWYGRCCILDMQQLVYICKGNSLASCRSESDCERVRQMVHMQFCVAHGPDQGTYDVTAILEW